MWLESVVIASLDPLINDHEYHMEAECTTASLVSGCVYLGLGYLYIWPITAPSLAVVVERGV